jgi:hypothetical protein
MTVAGVTALAARPWPWLAVLGLALAGELSCEVGDEGVGDEVAQPVSLLLWSNWLLLALCSCMVVTVGGVCCVKPKIKWLALAASLCLRPQSLPTGGTAANGQPIAEQNRLKI